MNKLEATIDPRDAAVRERRFRQEEERKKRIFNPRTRLIGVDLEGLNRQLVEKATIENEERLRHQMFEADRLRNDRVATLMDERIEQDKRNLGRAIDRFRLEYQRPEERREFDLYDPMGLKKELPQRVCDDDPRCTVSGLQKFEGEDLSRPARVKLQQQQFENRILEQKQLQKESEDNLKRANDVYYNQLLDLDRRACDLMDAETACRRAVDIAVKNYNVAFMKQKAEDLAVKKQREIEDNFTEISNTVFGDIMSENPEQARSSFGPHRVITDRWKGMTKEQVDDIRRMQLTQIRERAQMTEDEKLRDKMWDTHSLEMARTGMLKELEVERQKRDLDKRIASENKVLARRQGELLDYLNRNVHRNMTGAKFYDQFNKTVR